MSERRIRYLGYLSWSGAWYSQFQIGADQYNYPLSFEGWCREVERVVRTCIAQKRSPWPALHKVKGMSSMWFRSELGWPGNGSVCKAVERRQEQTRLAL